MISSFPPFVNDETEILILGSIPGVISLTKQEYYGNKNNQFWKIIYSIFDTLPVSDHYDEKISLLIQNKIGIWDVLANCERKGSLDMHIKNQTENNINELLLQFPKIKQVLFNGKESYRYFNNKFGSIEGISYHVLPSTSPANTMKFEEKLRLWREVLKN